MCVRGVLVRINVYVLMQVIYVKREEVCARVCACVCLLCKLFP